MESEDYQPRPPIEFLTGSLVNSLQELAQLTNDVESLVPEAYDEEMSEDASLTLRRLNRFAKDLSYTNLDLLPAETTQEVNRYVGQILNHVQQLQNYRARGSGMTTSALEGYGKSLYEADNDFKRALGAINLWLGFLLLQNINQTDITAIRNEIMLLNKQAQGIPQLIQSSVTDALKEVNDISDRMRTMEEAGQIALSNIGVDKHTKDFNKVREEHGTAARNWLIVAGAIIAVILSTPFWIQILLGVSGEWNSAENLQRFGIKILFLTTLFFLASQAVKNYRTNRHLEVVNRHRATALLTFRTFVDSDKDEQTKSAILLEAARTIFSPVPTGYVHTPDDEPDSRIYELVRILRGK
jgi:hypothetical protein